jgi:hypothetical protein
MPLRKATNMHLKAAATALLACAAFVAQAQLAPLDPDWKEADAPPPAALKLDGLIPIDQPGSSLRFGVAPGSVAVGSDGIVRYVVVARGTSGTVNAIYEGIRCKTGEFRVYARYNPSGTWVPNKDPLWHSIHDPQPSAHTLTIARTGACIGDGTNRSAEQIVRDLRGSVDHRFEGSATR